MKKRLFLLVFSIFFILGITNVYADDCSYTEEYELMQEAAKVKVKYATKEKFVEADGCAGMEFCSDVKKRYFEIYILNLSEKFYIETENSITKEIKKYTYDDVNDGIITIIDEDISNVKNYTLKIYADANTNCYSKKIATQYLSLPRFNKFYDHDFCSNNPDYSLCQEYVEFTEMDYEEFVNKSNKYIEDNNTKEEKEKTIFEKIINFIKNNIVYVISSIVIVALLVTGYVIIRKRRAI